MSTAPLLLVAATRMEEHAFWSDSLLGRSLVRPAYAGYSRCLGYANRRALAHTYNRGLDQAADDALVVFCHDDLWLGEQPLVPPLTKALESPETQLLISAASAWEIATKWRLGKLPGASEVVENFQRVMDGLGAIECPILSSESLLAGS